MKENIETNLRKVVEVTTRKAAIEEWSTAANKQKVPLYNYRFDHILEVVDLTKYIAGGTEANIDEVILAAWLHDIAKPGIGGISTADHGNASAEIAEEILLEEGVEYETISKVCNIIRKHVGLIIKETLEPIEAQVLWEADKILKLGLVGLFQFVLNGVRIFPGQTLKEINTRLHEFLPLAADLVACVVTERGKEVAMERLRRLHLLADMLETELNPGNEKGEK